MIMNPPSDIEPLSMPPPIIGSYFHHHHNGQGGTEPPPPTPSTINPIESTFHDRQMTQATPHTDAQVPSGPLQPASGDHSHDPASNGSTNASGRGTPRAKFLETLQGKSAWDALIHGTFT